MRNKSAMKAGDNEYKVIVYLTPTVALLSLFTITNQN